MSDQTAYPAAGTAVNGLAAGAALPGAGRRITAESFRALTARLKSAEASTAVIPAFAVPEVPAEAAPHRLEAAALPVALDPSETAALDEMPMPEPEPAVATAASVLADFGLPAFTPLQPIAVTCDPEAPCAEPAETEAWMPARDPPKPSAVTPPAAVDLAPFCPETFWEPLAAPEAAPLRAVAPEPVSEPEPEQWPAPEAEPVAADQMPAFEPADDRWPDLPEAPTIDVAAEAAPVEAEPPAVPEVDLAPLLPSAPADGGAEAVAPETPVETVSDKSNPLVDRVVEAMLKTVTDAVYARPSNAERAAFLRDIATLLEAEGGAAPAPPSVEREPAEATPIDAAVPEPVAPDPAEEAAAVLSDSLADRLGPTSALLRKSAEAPDPFSRALPDAIRLEPKPRETADADENSGELALSLLDMMSAGSASGLPQERALAADTLLRMIPRVPVKQLMAVVERMAIMESPPSLLVAKLIRDPRAEVIGPLLERCMHITDQDLINASVEGDSAKRRMIARRRTISPALSDHLIANADSSVLLTLIRNPGAGFSHDAFFRLAEQAGQNAALLAPLCTRADLPAPVAFELFWFVPPELRRFILSRFLTDSETLNRILKITLATPEGAEHKFPNRESLDEALDLAVQGKLEQAAQILAGVAGIAPDTALRIFADKDGEPLTVILKALGYPRGKFEESMGRLKNSDYQLLEAARNIAELQSIFDMLSFNKARILLTYWDWFVLKSGPYAPHN